MIGQENALGRDSNLQGPKEIPGNLQVCVFVGLFY